MFTGLIDDVGRVEHVAQSAAGCEIRVRCRYTDLAPGESVAVDGACLTVRDHGGTEGWFTVAAIGPTLERTTIGAWAVGRRVNLERALRAGDRLGGHIVQGHVDGVGTVVAVRQEGDARLVSIELPAGLGDALVPHGAITVNGVSLTVNELSATGAAEVALIEYTLRHTTLGTLAAGSPVHIECDVVGKYVQALVAPYLAAVAGGGERPA